MRYKKPLLEVSAWHQSYLLQQIENLRWKVPEGDYQNVPMR